MRFIADVSDRLDLQQSQSEVGTVTNDCATKSLAEVSFGSGHDREKLEQSLVGTSPSFPWMMRKLRLSFDQQDQRKKVAVVFLGETLDGAEFRKVQRETGRAKFMGIQILVVGVGTRVNSRQASFLATQANQVFFAMSYDSLGELEGPLLLQICTLKWTLEYFSIFKDVYLLSFCAIHYDNFSVAFSNYDRFLAWIAYVIEVWKQTIFITNISWTCTFFKTSQLLYLTHN